MIYTYYKRHIKYFTYLLTYLPMQIQCDHSTVLFLWFTVFVLVLRFTGMVLVLVFVLELAVLVLVLNRCL